MNVEHELADSLKHIPMLEQQVASQGETLEEQAGWLESRIDDLISQHRDGWDYSQRTEAISKLSLLSQLCAVLSFDRMIEAREKFQSLFPEHFKEYLDRLDLFSWQVSWPGCLECRHFEGKCSLGLAPMENPGGRYGFEKNCKSQEGRARAA